MGQELVRAVHAAPGCVVVGGIERADSPALDRDIGLVAASAISASSSPRTRWSSSPVPKLCSTSRRGSPPSNAGSPLNARIVHVIAPPAIGRGRGCLPRPPPRPHHKRQHEPWRQPLVALTRKVAQALGENFDIEILEMHTSTRSMLPPDGSDAGGGCCRRPGNFA